MFLMFTTLDMVDKLKVLEVFGEYAVDARKYASLADAAKDASIKAIGKSTHYHTIRRWAESDETIATIVGGILLERAESFMALAQQELDAIQDFWESTFVDSRGREYKIMKERMSAVNKAKLKIEHYRFHASKLSPDVWGDYGYEIKKVTEQMKGMQKQLDDITHNKT